MHKAEINFFCSPNEVPQKLQKIFRENTSINNNSYHGQLLLRELYVSTLAYVGNQK